MPSRVAIIDTPAPPPPPEPPRRRWHWLALALFAAIKLLLTWQHQIVVIGFDDGGFAIAATHGYWGQPYNLYAFVRQPVYPLFAWICGSLGLPVRAAIELLWIAASIGLFAALRTCSIRPVAALAAAVLTMFHPWSIAWLDRLMQDTLYAPLMWMFILGLAASLAAADRRRTWLWGLIAAISGAFAASTRPESILVYGSIAVAAAIALLRPRFAPDPVRFRARVLSCVVLPLALTFALGLGIKLKNRAELGVACACELLMPGQTALYNALLAIEPGTPDPLVAIRRDVRERAYDASPTFAILREPLDGETRLVQFSRACRNRTGVEGEYGAWSLWALRAAAFRARTDAGLPAFASPAELDAFFAQAASELRTAMSDGRLNARPVPISMLPPEWTMIARRLPAALSAAAEMTLLPPYERARPMALNINLQEAYRFVNAGPPTRAGGGIPRTRRTPDPEPPADALEPVKDTLAYAYRFFLMPLAGLLAAFAALRAATTLVSRGRTRLAMPASAMIGVLIVLTALGARLLLVALLDITGIFLSPRYLLVAPALLFALAAAAVGSAASERRT